MQPEPTFDRSAYGRGSEPPPAPALDRDAYPPASGPLWSALIVSGIFAPWLTALVGMGVAFAIFAARHGAGFGGRSGLPIAAMVVFIGMVLLGTVAHVGAQIAAIVFLARVPLRDPKTRVWLILLAILLGFVGLAIVHFGVTRRWLLGRPPNGFGRSLGVVDNSPVPVPEGWAGGYRAPPPL